MAEWIQYLHSLTRGRSSDMYCRRRHFKVTPVVILPIQYSAVDWAGKGHMKDSHRPCRPSPSSEIGNSEAYAWRFDPRRCVSVTTKAVDPAT